MVIRVAMPQTQPLAIVEYKGGSIPAGGEYNHPRLRNRLSFKYLLLAATADSRSSKVPIVSAPTSRLSEYCEGFGSDYSEESEDGADGNGPDVANHTARSISDYSGSISTQQHIAPGLPDLVDGEAERRRSSRHGWFGSDGLTSSSNTDFEVATAYGSQEVLTSSTMQQAKPASSHAKSMRPSGVQASARFEVCTPNDFVLKSDDTANAAPPRPPHKPARESSLAAPPQPPKKSGGNRTVKSRGIPPTKLAAEPAVTRALQISGPVIGLFSHSRAATRRDPAMYKRSPAPSLGGRHNAARSALPPKAFTQPIAVAVPAASSNHPHINTIELGYGYGVLEPGVDDPLASDEMYEAMVLNDADVKSKIKLRTGSYVRLKFLVEMEDDDSDYSNTRAMLYISSDNGYERGLIVRNAEVVQQKV